MVTTNALLNRIDVRARVAVLALGWLSLIAPAHAISWKATSDFVWSVSGNVAEGNVGTGSGSTILNYARPTATGMEFSAGRALPWSPQPNEYSQWAKWKASITPKSVAKEIVSPRALMGGIAGAVGLALVKQLIDQACVRLSNGANELKPGVAWDECVPVAAQVPPDRRYGLNSSTLFASKEAMCTAVPRSKYTFVSADSSADPDSGVCKFLFEPNDQPGTIVTAGSWQAIYICPNGVEVAKSSTCAGFKDSATYRPASNDKATTRIADAFDKWNQADFLYGYDPSNHNDTRSADVVRELLNKGAEIETGNITVDGPSTTSAPTVSTSTTTTTVSDPTPSDPSARSTTVTTTTTTNNYNYNYNNNQVTRTDKTDVQECKTTTKGDGTVLPTSCTGSSTSTDKPKGEDPSDLCKLHPDILACKELDTPEGEIPRSQKELTYQVDDQWGGGSCPADLYSTIHGVSYKVWDYQQTCSYVSTYLRPVLLVLAAFSAFMILVPGRSD